MRAHGESGRAGAAVSARTQRVSRPLLQQSHVPPTPTYPSRPHLRPAPCLSRACPPPPCVVRARLPHRAHRAVSSCPDAAHGPLTTARLASPQVKLGRLMEQLHACVTAEQASEVLGAIRKYLLQGANLQMTYDDPRWEDECMGLC